MNPESPTTAHVAIVLIDLTIEVQILTLRMCVRDVLLHDIISNVYVPLYAHES